MHTWESNEEYYGKKVMKVCKVQVILQWGELAKILRLEVFNSCVIPRNVGSCQIDQVVSFDFCVFNVLVIS
jgi:hypothetical protein